MRQLGETRQIRHVAPFDAGLKDRLIVARRNLDHNIRLDKFGRANLWLALGVLERGLRERKSITLEHAAISLQDPETGKRSVARYITEQNLPVFFATVYPDREKVDPDRAKRRLIALTALKLGGSVIIDSFPEYPAETS